MIGNDVGIAKTREIIYRYAGTQNYMREKETSRLRVGTDDPNSMSGTQEAQIKKVLDQFPDISYNIYKGLKKYPLTYDSFK